MLQRYSEVVRSFRHSARHLGALAFLVCTRHRYHRNPKPLGWTLRIVLSVLFPIQLEIIVLHRHCNISIRAYIRVMVALLMTHPALNDLRLINHSPSSDNVHSMALVLVLVKLALVLASLPLSSSSIGCSIRVFITSLLLHKDTFGLIFLTNTAVRLLVTWHVTVKTGANELLLLSSCIGTRNVRRLYHCGQADYKLLMSLNNLHAQVVEKSS